MTESPIIFYCKDCEKIVDADKLGRKYVYKCGICGTKNVAFGTEKSIKSFFRVKEEIKVPEKKEVPKKEEVKAAPEKKEVPKKEEVKAAPEKKEEVPAEKKEEPKKEESTKEEK